MDLAAARSLPVGTVVTVRATVVAEAGRLGTPALIAVADATAGIAVRLPSGVTEPARGTLLQVTGAIAAPYGQLELRPARDGVIDAGAGALPEPQALAATGPDESSEGRLVVATGRLAARPATSSSGDVTLTLERTDGSPVKVFADASSAIAASAFSVGGTYRVTGIVGQRATRTGALDGYRLCLRDAADVAIVAPPPTPRPSATASPTARPTASASASPPADRPISIAAAKRTSGRSVAIVAVVTAPASLLDGSGKLFVVQDGSGAIEVRAPSAVTAPAVGSRVRIDGSVGTSYGAPRLAATRIERLGTASVPAPMLLYRSPGLAQEWRLVTVRGRIDSVSKLGDRWRAELLVGKERVVVLGQAGAGIPVASVLKGHLATVVGIVRRPYPTAKDRRYAILPRGRSDLRVDGLAATGTASGGGGATDGPGHAGGPGTATSTGQGASRPPTGAASAVPDADLIDLASLDGVSVRVGGIVGDLLPDGFLLDDGTAVGPVILHGEAADLLPLIEPGDAVNVTGRVDSTERGWTVVADDPAGVVLAGDPTGAATPAPSAGPSLDAGPAAAPVSPTTAGIGPFAGHDLTGIAGLGTLASLTLLSLLVTMVRRRVLRRRLSGLVAARLAAVAGPRPALPGPPDLPRSG